MLLKEHRGRLNNLKNKRRLELPHGHLRPQILRENNLRQVLHQILLEHQLQSQQKTIKHHQHHRGTRQYLWILIRVTHIGHDLTPGYEVGVTIILRHPLDNIDIAQPRQEIVKGQPGQGAHLPGRQLPIDKPEEGATD